jgi:hypothetical protein
MRSNCQVFHYSFICIEDMGKMIAEHLTDQNGLWNVTLGKKRNVSRIKYDLLAFVNTMHPLPLRNTMTIQEMARFHGIPVIPMTKIFIEFM